MKRAVSLVISIVVIFALALQTSAISTIKVKSIQLNADRVNLKTGQTYALKATLTPANTTQKRLKYVTSNKNVATISAYGGIKAVAPGTATITVSSYSNSKVLAKCTVVVRAVAPNPMPLTLLIPQNPSLPAFGEKHLFYQEILKTLKVKLKVISVVGNDYETRKNLMLASGELPDIFFDSTRNLSGYMEDGVVIDIREFLNQNGPDIANLLKDKLALYMVSDKKGRILGVPEVNEVIWTNGLIYRKDWTDQLGLKLPNTMDELYQFLKTIKEKDPAGDGKTIPYSTRDKSYIGITESMTNFKNGRSVAWDMYKKLFVCDSISPEYKNALVYMNKLYKEGLMDSEFATTNTQQWQQKVTSGNVAVTYDNLSRFYVFSYMFQTAEPDTTKSMALLPPIKDSKGNRATQLFDGIAGASNIMTGTNVRLFALTKANKYPEESIKFLNYYFTDAGAKTSNIGVEGVTYKTENGKPTPIMSTADMSSRYYSMNSSNWPGYKTWEAIDMLGGGVYDPIKAYVKSYGKQSTIEPPITLSSANADTVKERLAIIDTYVEECRIKFITGQMSFDEWDTYVKRVGIMGADEVIKLYNEELVKMNALK